MKRLLAIVAIAAALVALPGCGQKTDEAKRAAGMVPPNAIAFLSASLDPSIAQKKNLLTMAARFPKAREKLKKNFNDTRDSLLNDALKQACLDYQKDVKPWLGSEVAIAVLPHAGDSSATDDLVLIRVKDEAKARASLEQATTATCDQGSQQQRDFRIVDGFAVVAVSDDAAANKAALDAVESTAKANDGGLAKSEDFARLVDELHGDRLLLGYVDGKQAVAASGETGTLESNGCNILESAGTSGKAAFDLHAGSSSIVLEGVADQSPTPLKGGDPQLTEALPDTTTGTLTVFDIAGLVRTALSCTGQQADVTGQLADQTGLDLDLDVLPWMSGEAVLVTGPFHPGRSIPDIGFVVKTTNHEKAVQALGKLKAKLTEDGQQLTDFDVNGTKGTAVAQLAEDGTQPALVLLPDRLIVATSPDYAKALASPASAPIANTRRYKAVIDPNAEGTTQTQLFVDVKAIKDAIVASLPADSAERYRRDVAPQLDPLDSIGLRLSNKNGLSFFDLRVALR